MHATLTSEELNTINSIIPQIPIDRQFAIFSLIQEHVVKPKYENTNGGIDLGKYNLEITTNKSKGLYKNVENCLLDGDFVQKVDEHNSNGIFQLTKRGVALVAYGKLELLHQSESASDEQDIINRITLTIQSLYPYGEFDIELELPKQRILSTNLFTGSEQEQLSRVKEILDWKLQMQITYRNWFLDCEVLEYLVMHGFAINRHDIKQPNKIYRQLTDRGRELKQEGSIEAYNALLQQRREAIEADERRQATERQRSDNEYERNYYLFWITAAIAVATGVQGAWNLMELVRNYYNPYLPYFLYLIPACVIVILVFVIRVLWLKVRQPRRQKIDKE